MRRWNGWGDDAVDAPLAPAARALLASRIGAGVATPDASLADVVRAMPASRLPAHALVSDDAELRVRHARGQSLPDWIALRSGRVGRVADGVARPSTGVEVRQLLDWARAVGARVVPYGGGTSVVGHLDPGAGDAPLLTLALDRLSSLTALDETSGLATIGAGATGPQVEAQLAARGFTLGHFPQSFEHSTLGGWIVTRSAGQQALRYGRIEQLFAGGRVECPHGALELAPVPASAAGPDLRELVMGSEGRLGVVTEAVVRASRLPERETFFAVFFPEWTRGIDAMRAIAQSRAPLSMLRLSNAEETDTTLRLAGHAGAVRLLESMLRVRGAGMGKCMLLVGATGSARLVRAARREALAIARAHGGVHAGTALGARWARHRFHLPYLRNTLWELGWAVDTMETAVPWRAVDATALGIETSLRGALTELEERVHVFTHLSHAYPTGSSIYTTVVFRRDADPDATLARWRKLKDAASAATRRGGGTISHQHGVGLDHRAWAAAEKGPTGVAALQAMLRHFDPDGLLDRGTLLP